MAAIVSAPPTPGRCSASLGPGGGPGLGRDDARPRRVVRDPPCAHAATGDDGNGRRCSHHLDS
ncbi:MAG: hypothetical protein R2710_30655 [Acidimicrobiales bacterium]